MVGFVDVPRGIGSEPLAGIVLALFDGRYGSEERALRTGCFMRMFVLQCRTGSCDLEFRGNRLKVAQGEVCVVCSTASENVRCSLRCSNGFTGSLLGLSRKVMPEATCQMLKAFDVDTTVFDRLIEGGSTVRKLQGEIELEHAYALLYLLPTNADKGLLRLRAIELLYVLSHVSFRRNKAGTLHKLTHDEIARRAQEVMMRDLSQPLTISATAKLCGTSPTVLKESFREVFGESVHEWYRACRMREAAKLLETTSYSVAQVASEVGYSNPSKFSRVFYEHMGSTPSVWRSAHRV